MGSGIDWPFCVECFNKWFVFGCLEPFVILRTLRSDCLYWQGMYSPDEHSLNSPLMGGLGALRKDSVETIAGMLTDIRMVKQIPYGMVTFDDKRRYAAGASARVYKGHLFNSSKSTKEVRVREERKARQGAGVRSEATKCCEYFNGT